MQIDYPHIRNRATCPCCNKPKSAGLLVCWSCYRFHNFRNGGESRFTSTLNNLELQLASLNQARGVQR